ncbi:MAG: sulfite exporter TauE/SafE family protein [Deltaproteobacteria bacterium]|nr:sulfite exporter TauE/SafE family protein [Deltaproteobacteria bacterium]
MDILLISIVALMGSGLTFFSGFGLGTILLPVFSLFFPIQVAVGLTAVVHFLNNLFKLGLVGRHVDKSVFLRFSLPTIPAAFVGSYLLVTLTDFDPLFTYMLNGTEYSVEPVKVAIAVLMVIFCMFEIVPKLNQWTVDKKLLPLGGVLSGFFGGLSGHQGALRSAFLIRTGISKEKFIGTGIVTACLVDFIRISVYGTHMLALNFNDNIIVLVAATLSAFTGAYIGNKLLKKITFKGVQLSVAVLLGIIAILLGSGII